MSLLSRLYLGGSLRSYAVGGWATCRQRQNQSLIRSSAGKDSFPRTSDVSTALESLDALLSSTDGDDGPPSAGSTPQALAGSRRAYRRTAMNVGTAGKFMDLDAYTRGRWSYLNVGQQTQVGASHAQLPASEPLVAYLFAGWALLASTSVVLFPSIFPSEDMVMYSELVEEGGSLWPFLWANWVAPTWLDLAVGVGALLTAGAAAERLLGRGRFATMYVLSGVTAHVWYYALSPIADPSAFHCGVAGGMLGVCAALATVGVKNARELTLKQQLELWASALGGGAAVVAADAYLWADHTFVGGAYVAAVLAGLLLGAGTSPNYSVLREMVIPDGSMEIPEDAEEVQVVVDKTSGLAQWGACLAYALALGAFTLALTSLSVEGLQWGLGVHSERELVGSLEHYLKEGGPEAAQELYDVAPEAWPLKL